MSWLECFAAHMIAKNKLRHGFEHRHFDGLPRAGSIPMNDGGKHRMRGADAANPVHHRKRNVSRLRSGDRRANRRDRDRALNDIVIGRAAAVRTRFGIAGQADVNNVVLYRANVVEAEAEPPHGRASYIVNEDIGVGAKLQKRLLSFGLLHIKGETALVSVRVEKHRAHRRAAHGRCETHHVAFERLDLHDIGTVIGQNLCGDRPHDHGRQIDDLQSGKRARAIAVTFRMHGHCGRQT